MYGLVLDPSSLILCSCSSEEDERVVRRLGDTIYGLEGFIIYLSSMLVRGYETVVIPRNRRHHPLPKFQSSPSRIINHLHRLVRRTRGLLCKVRNLGANMFHVIEESRLLEFNVNDLGLEKEEDKNILRIALAATNRHEEVFLVTLDREFLNGLSWRRLSGRYPREAERLKVVRPDDPRLIAVLVKLALRAG